MVIPARRVWVGQGRDSVLSISQEFVCASKTHT